VGFRGKDVLGVLDGTSTWYVLCIEAMFDIDEVERVLTG